MKILGLVGGGSLSTNYRYLAAANDIARARSGGLHTARCVLFAPDVAEIEQLQAAGRWTEATDVLADAARAVAGAGAQIVLLCGSTAHYAHRKVTEAIDVPVPHIGDVVADAVRSATMRRVGLIGATFEIDRGVYRAQLEAAGLDVMMPSPADRASVHRIVYEELCRGTVTDRARAEIDRVIDTLAASGAQGVVLANPDIETMIGGSGCVPVFPATSLHIRSAVRWALPDGAGERDGRGDPAGVTDPTIVTADGNAISAAPDRARRTP